MLFFSLVIMYSSFSHKSDVWSYGVVLYEIWSKGKEPYYGYSNAELRTKVLEGKEHLEIPEGTPKRIKEIMLQCFQYEASQRPTFEVEKKKISFI